MIQNLCQLDEAARRIDCKRFDEQTHEHCGVRFTTWRNGEHWFAQIAGRTDFGVGVDLAAVMEMAEAQIDDGDSGDD